MAQALNKSGPVLPLSVFAASAAILIAIALFVYQGLRDDRRASTEAGLKAVAELKVGQLESWLYERRADIAYMGTGSLLASQFDRWSRAGGRDPATLALIQERLAALRENYEYDTIALYDTEGRPRIQGGTEPVAEHGADAISAMRQDKSLLVNFHRHPGQPVRIGMVAPLKYVDASGKRLVGALYLSVSAEKKLLPRLHQWPLPSKTGEIVLARRDGDAFFFVAAGKVKQDSLRVPAGNAFLPAARIEGGERGILRGARDYAGVPVLAYADRVPGTSWILVAKQDQSEVDAPLQGSARWLALIAMSLLGCAGAAIWFWWRAVEGRHRSNMLQQRLEQAVMTEQARLDLLASEEKYRVLADYSTDWEYWLGPDRRFRYVSPACETVCGYPPADFYADPDLMERIIHADDRPLWHAHLEEPRDAGQAIHAPLRLRILTRQGETRWIEHACTGVYDAAGEYLGRRGGNRDITEIKAAEQERALYREKLEAEVRQRTADLTQRTQQLETANRDLENFSYSVSHDLRAPLRAIDGYIAILLEEHLGQLDDDGRRMFGIVADNARRMGHLIDDILAFSRAGRLELASEPVDMRALVEEVWAALTENDAGRVIELQLDDLPAAYCDPRAIRQVWQNLLANAIKFTRDRAPAIVRVAATDEGACIRYQVADNGVGFNQEYAGRLFVLFQRLHGMDEFEGTGVGLAIVKRFIERHGGEVVGIGVLGQGATFSFTLPKLRDVCPS